MTVKRYAAATSREALAKVRVDLGPEAVILSSKRTPTGVEVTAMRPGELERMIATPTACATPERLARDAATPPRGPEGARSFREFVARAYGAESGQASPAPSRDNARLEAEIAQLKQTLAKGLAELAWNGAAHRHPARARLAERLVDAGLSRELARTATDKLDAGADSVQASAWFESLLAHNLSVAGGHDLVETGGVFALVGPTGAGKTTSVAKIAARAVVRFGAAKVALIAADGFRVGAQDQLRTYAQILGVPLYVATDRDSLERTLEALKERHLVLIDTAGLGPRDARLQEQSRLLDLARVKKILMLPATAQSESLERSVVSYAHGGAHGAVITKLDEAVKLGAVIETALRHRLALHFVANGQRVPEDLHPAHAKLLAHRTLRASGDAGHAAELRVKDAA